MIRVEAGDTVKVLYTGRLADGTIFDAATPERPLHFVLGRGEVIPGFDEAVTGMYLQEKKTVTVTPGKAYGAHDPTLVEEVDRALLPPQVNPQVGRQLEVTHQNGDRLLILVTGATETTVTLDANHPLAGKDLIFDIEVLEVKKRPPVPGGPPAPN